MGVKELLKKEVKRAGIIPELCPLFYGFFKLKQAIQINNR
ncbi:hypothetical protein BN133_1849 [Cronobacter dublinensis 582]|nr:hypothetical protein BN133_1849 [Cronobacter dublinensis 582]